MEPSMSTVLPQCVKQSPSAGIADLSWPESGSQSKIQRPFRVLVVANCNMLQRKDSVDGACVWPEVRDRNCCCSVMSPDLAGPKMHAACSCAPAVVDVKWRKSHF